MSNSKQMFIMKFKFKIALITILLLVVITYISNMQPVDAASKADICKVFDKMTGEWVGVCDQKTDGEELDRQYFVVNVKKTGEDVYQSKFSYYIRNEKTGSPEPAGSMLIVTVLKADGRVVNRINGEGRVMFNGKPKTQKYEIIESIILVPDGTIRSSGSGEICVDGIPFGLGKNGKLTDTKSVWRFYNGVFSICQEVNAKFKALFVSKSYKFRAEYSASKGSNISEFMAK